MKSITLPIAELKPALTGLGKVINQRSGLPVLHHVKVERTTEGWIALTGTDLDRFVTMRLEHPADGAPASMLLPFDQLLQITKSCGKGESIEVESYPEASVIRFPLGDTLGESKIAFLSPDEFPATPKIKSYTIPLPSSIRETIHEAMECASTDSTRYVLNGTFIDASNPKANYIVGTDGKHLYSANSFALPLKNSLIIPNHKFIGWKDFNLDGEWQMKAGDENVQLSSRRWRFISKTIEGTYPNCHRVVPNPNDAKTILTIDPARLEALIKVIQRMPCHDDERHHTLGLEWKDGTLVLLGKDKPQDEWLRVPVPDIKGEGPDLTIFLNRLFVIKALQFGLNTISLMDSMSPPALQPGREKADDRDASTWRFKRRACHHSISTSCRNGSNHTKLSAIGGTTPMQTHPQPNGRHHPAGTNGNPATVTTTDKQDTRTALESALVQVEAIKTSFREAINGLTKLGDSIRAAMREQKASEKEVHNVRQTLRSLQSVRL